MRRKQIFKSQIDETLQIDPSRTAVEEIGKLCDGIDKSEAVGSEFF